MINHFEIKNFKCHEDNNHFPLPGITIVSGTNNSGKSSLLQSIFLTTQAKGRTYPILAANDELRIGSFSDILNKNQPNSATIEFSFNFDNKLLAQYGVDEFNVNLSYKNPSVFEKLPIPFFESNPFLSSIEIVLKKEGEEQEIYSLEIVDERTKSILYKIDSKYDKGYCKVEGIVPEPIIYSDLKENERVICSSHLDIIRSLLKLVSTENIKYMKAFRVDNYVDSPNNKVSEIGLSGQNTAEVIHKYRETISDFKFKGSDETLTFSKVFNYWIEKLLGTNYKIRSNSIDKDKFKVTIYETKTDIEYSLNQVGFGISQILPLITLLLTSKKNDLILIENPEVHLHPKLQSLFVDLCIFVLENERKLVIETHSEHIINRLRFKIKENPKILSEINILFFEKDDEGFVKYSDIEITKEGRLASWPKNFFDQTYNDLLGLIDQ